MDETNTCIDCGASFILTESNREWYLEKGFQLPRRCGECRRRRKVDQEALGARRLTNA